MSREQAQREKAQRELEELGLVRDPPGYMLVRGVCWPMEAWLMALSDAVLQHLESRIPEGGSLRAAMRAVRFERDAGHFPAVWRIAVELLEASEVKPLTPDEVAEVGAAIAGVIPLDEASTPR